MLEIAARDPRTVIPGVDECAVDGCERTPLFILRLNKSPEGQWALGIALCFTHTNQLREMDPVDE